MGCITYGASLGSGAGCSCPSVADLSNYASLRGGFKSTLCIGVDLFANRTSVIFLVTGSFAGRLRCFCFCELVGTSQHINGSVFVALSVANCTFLVLDTFVVNGRLNVNYPFIIVNSLTGGATTVVTLCITNARPSVAGCKRCAIVGITTYATGVKDVAILFTGGANDYNSSITVSRSGNCVIRYANFNSTVYISVSLTAF